MNTRETLQLLRRYESRNVTFMEDDGSWPIVWERAQGVSVWDAEGKRYLDLTAAFGVAAAGHANPRIVRAGQRQMGRLLHAMGDVHPHALKAQLAAKLSRLTFERWTGAGSGSKALCGKTIFCNSGFEAVEAALKTAVLATGKSEVIVFEGAYHGLGYGALNATHRSLFRSPFRRQIGEFGHFVLFPDVPDHLAGDSSLLLEKVESQMRKAFRKDRIGAVLVEPIQTRGGIRVPPVEFLPLLRQLCDEYGALLILDEIYTGFGRTGKWFACEHSKTIPDVVCLGKALTGGFPLSACVGRNDVMDVAWPSSEGEAIHTSTFLGHPVGCAMGLAELKEIESRGLVQCAEKLGKILASALADVAARSKSLKAYPRGQGLLAGLELLLPDGSPATQIVLKAIKDLLNRGFLLLPEGEQSHVVSFSPPLTISRKQLLGAVAALAKSLKL